MAGTDQRRSESLDLTIRYEDAGDGWITAQVAAVSGAVSQRKTCEVARANVIDALQASRRARRGTNSPAIIPRDRSG